MPERRVELWRKGVDSREFERALRGSLSERAMSDLVSHSSPERLQELYRNYRIRPHFDSKLKLEPAVLADQLGIPFTDFQALNEIGAPLGSFSKLREGFESGLIKEGDLATHVSRFDRELFDSKDIIDSYLFQLARKQRPQPSP
jgi:hypothetical protein